MSDRINALGIARARTDADKALVLTAICAFADSIGDSQLAEEAKSMMPCADPFSPPHTWRQEYDKGFQAVAREECGVYLDDMHRYGTEFWQSMSDDQRRQRLGSPHIGDADGRRDANALNEA